MIAVSCRCRMSAGCRGIERHSLKGKSFFVFFKTFCTFGAGMALKGTSALGRLSQPNFYIHQLATLACNPTLDCASPFHPMVLRLRKIARSRQRYLRRKAMECFCLSYLQRVQVVMGIIFHNTDLVLIEISHV